MTPHFAAAELACKCGCGMLPKQDFMDKVETLRVKLGRPLRVSSAARCPEHNAKVAARGLTGPHTTGRAIDLLCSGLIAYEGNRTVLSKKGLFELVRHLDPTIAVRGRQRPRVRRPDPAAT